MRIESGNVTGTIGYKTSDRKTDFDRIRINVQDKLSQGSHDPEMAKMKDLKQAALKKNDSAAEQKEPSKLKLFLMNTGKILMLGMVLIGPLALTGCGSSGGSAETTAPPTQIEKEVEQKTEAPKPETKQETKAEEKTGEKTGGGSIFDKYLTKEAQEKLKGIAKQTEEIVKGPGTIKEKAEKVAKEATHGAKEAAEDFIKKDAKDLIDAAKKTQEQGGDNLKENAGEVIQKGADYFKKKTEQVKDAYETTK